MMYLMCFYCATIKYEQKTGKNSVTNLYKITSRIKEENKKMMNFIVFFMTQKIIIINANKPIIITPRGRVLIKSNIFSITNNE